MITKKAPVNVLVTGMGPYPVGNGHRIDPNISHVLTTLLPDHLEPDTATNPSPNPINIITLPFPIKAEYAYVRRFCRELHAPRDGKTIGLRFQNQMESEFDTVSDIDMDDVDLVIHLGEARGWNYITIERMAFKQGFTSNWWSVSQEKAYYDIVDDAGKTVYDIGPCPWEKVPMGLQNGLDVDGVAGNANAVLKTRSRFAGRRQAANRYLKTVPDELASAEVGMDGLSLDVDRPIEIKPHREGGAYLCGFTNYESLANCYAHKRKMNVLFCHVPGLEDAKGLEWQKDGVLALVVSAAREVVRQRN